MRPAGRALARAGRGVVESRDMNEQSFEDAVCRICEKGADYDAEAFYFLREGLDRATRKVAGESDGARRHVSGRELCEALRDHALKEFGPLALLVLTQWGVYETADFGRMVYALIAEGVFGKNAGDRPSDFDDVFDFEEAFAKPWEPPARSA